MALIQCALLVALAGVAMSHVCLITPRQRGTMDISMPGSPDCFRHAEPCGGQAVEMPKVTYKAGETAFIKWQQNLNHYEPGYPGYFDLGIAPDENSTDFKTLAVVTDEYVHRQDYQKNVTAIIKIPPMMCDHCVMRIRYNAHKPGEETFLQCADVKVTLGSDSGDNALKFLHDKEHSQEDRRKLQPLKRALRLRKFHQQKNGDVVNDNMKLYGIAYNPFEPGRSHYISIDTMTGQTEMVNSFSFGIDTPFSGDAINRFMIDEIVSIDYGRNTSNLIVHDTGSRDDTAKQLYIIGTYNGSLVQYSNIFQFTGGAINALSWYTFGTSAVFRIQPAEKEGQFYFEIGTLDFGGSYRMGARIPQPENLYVNFQWLETDVNNYHRVYALLGNENAPDGLDARIYIFDLYDSKFVKFTELDVSKYTFMSFHSYPGSDELYAFSPGLWFDDPHAWSLVAINPMTGQVTKKCDIAPPGIFQRFYGGSVNQGSSNDSGYLYHVLRVEGSDADVIVKVEPNTCVVSFSEPTNLRHIHSIQMPKM